MNKTELSIAIAEQSCLSKKDAESALNAFINVVSEELKKHNSVQIIGFGTFEVVKRAARNGVNPKTNEKIQIAESMRPKFKPGKALKELVKA